MKFSTISISTLILCIAQLTSGTALAESDADLARQLSNPVSSLISVPIQMNYDDGIGAGGGGSVWRTNIQPVIPFSLNDDWNLISRTIIPVINQSDVPLPGLGESGLGDILQSFFFSPAKPTSGGLIWGAGPVILMDTASDPALGSGKWGIGPTGVLLKQQGSWTYGVLANHIESVGGDSSRPDISATFLQPFVSYITNSQTTLGLNTESTYDWNTKTWAVPVNLTVNQLMKVGSQMIQVGGGVRYWADSPPNGPEGWGFRLQVTFLFPR